MSVCFHTRKKTKVTFTVWVAFFYVWFSSPCQAQFLSCHSVGLFGAVANSGQGFGIRFERQFDYRESWSMRIQQLKPSNNEWIARSFALGYCSLYPLKNGIFRVGFFVETGKRTFLESHEQLQNSGYSSPFLEMSYAFPIGESNTYLFTCANVGREWVWSGSSPAKTPLWPQQLTVGVYWNWCQHQLAKTI
jgi:hypothetical protein